MRKAMIMVAAMACCWFSGCMSKLTVNEIHWVVESIPEGIWGWDITIPGYTGESSFDLVKGVEVVIDLARGMLPIR